MGAGKLRAESATEHVSAFCLPRDFGEAADQEPNTATFFPPFNAPSASVAHV